MAGNEIHILNGNMTGKEEGEYTCIGKRGLSTVDYVMTNSEGRERIGEMAIGKRTGSDHLPLVITLKEELTHHECTEKRIHPDWSERGVAVYRGKLKKRGTEVMEKL